MKAPAKYLKIEINLTHNSFILRTFFEISGCSSEISASTKHNTRVLTQKYINYYDIHRNNSFFIAIIWNSFTDMNFLLCYYYLVTGYYFRNNYYVFVSF